MEGQGVSAPVRFSRQAKIIILAVGLALTIWLLARVGRILGPFVWAAITAYVLSPIVDWLEARLRLRRIWIVTLLYLVGLAAVAWALTALVPLLIAQAKGLAAATPQILTNLMDRLAFVNETLLAQQIQVYGLTIDPQVLVNEIMRNLQNLVTYVTSHAIPAVFNVIEGVGQAVLFLIATFYLLRAWPNLAAFLPRLVPRAQRSEFLSLAGAIDRVMGAYIRGQLLLILVMAAAHFVTLSILQVQYALIVALISGVLEVVPFFGPLMAGGVAVSIALFQPNTPFGWSNLTLALVVVVSYTVLRQIEDQLVVPNLVGPIVDLHPLLVLFALFAGGQLAGFTGLVVAVPTAAALKIVVLYLYGKIWDEQPAAEPAPATRPSPATDSHATPGEQP
ncbi:MAG TPA: AI-2E family transporter [Anaerolineae bacterium]|nr:AI-2E family transporter [Anaerolineae bacterium]HOQ98756.1 AI-2E family transporter [Anaerolineae bacterium]HPL29164.1 AI-2E family transporter [Anaerolineae bacterium]